MITGLHKLAMAAAALSVASLAPLGEALAEKADNTLDVTWMAALPTLDRYNSAFQEANITGHLIFDALIYRDPATFEYKPALAESWTWIDNTTLEFKLRPDVTFSNGEPFTADDVVYTFDWVTDKKNAVVTYNNVAWIDRTEKVDNLMVRIHLKDPFPSATEYLSGPLPIYPNEYHAKVGAQEFAVKPVGTGPYKVTDFVEGRSISLVPNDSHYQGSPKGRPSFAGISQRTIQDINTQVAELIAGGVDWMWQIPEDQIPHLRRVPAITVQSNESMRIGFMILDSAGRSGDTPLKNVKVRRAIMHAIDREAMVKNMVGENARVVHTFCFPTQFGCTDDGAAVYEYNPEIAKKLLAEAGYPGGFDMEIVADTYPHYTEAAITYLRAVGIRAELRAMKWPTLFKNLKAGNLMAAHFHWGSYGVNDVSALTSQFFRDGPTDYAQDPEVHGWLKQADTTVDPEERKTYYAKALNKMADQAYVVPFFSFLSPIAFSADLDCPKQRDEFPHLYRCRWKP